MKNLIVISPQHYSSKPPAAVDSSFVSEQNNNDSDVIFINDGRTFFIESQEAKGRVISTPFRYGWGGVQKMALTYALDHNYEGVTLLGFYNENTKAILKTFRTVVDQNTAVYGGKSNHNPIIKLYEWLLSRMCGRPLSNVMSLFRHYPLNLVKKTAYQFNTFGPHFDTEMNLQLLSQDVPLKVWGATIPKSCLGLSRFLNDFKTVIKYRLQKFGFLYDVRFHPELLNTKGFLPKSEQAYEPKFDDLSPHSLILSNPSLVPNNSTVLDIGCSTGYLCNELVDKKSCQAVGVDQLPQQKITSSAFRYIQLNLDTEAHRIANLIEEERCNVVLMLDVLEHLSNPEFFLLELFQKKYTTPPKFIFSTGNVAFFAVRMMLLLGYFNYGERGILDITHKRLFSHRTFKNLMEQTGFYVQKAHFIPPPFQKMGLSSPIFKFWARVYKFLLKIWPAGFSYQILFEAELPTLSSLSSRKTNP